MEWTEVFVVFMVSHLVGDYLLQTDWQAVNKRGGLSGNSESRRALVSHVSVYTLAFGPALVWIGEDLGAGWGIAFAAVIFFPHLVQDDGRMLTRYMSSVKQNKGARNDLLFMAVDQSFHTVILFLTALWVFWL